MQEKSFPYKKNTQQRCHHSLVQTKLKPNPVLTKLKPKSHINHADTQSASEIQKILIQLYKQVENLIIQSPLDLLIDNSITLLTIMY